MFPNKSFGGGKIWSSILCTIDHKRTVILPLFTNIPIRLRHPQMQPVNHIFAWIFVQWNRQSIMDYGLRNQKSLLPNLLALIFGTNKKRPQTIGTFASNVFSCVPKYSKHYFPNLLSLPCSTSCHLFYFKHASTNRRQLRGIAHLVLYHRRKEGLVFNSDGNPPNQVFGWTNSAGHLGHDGCVRRYYGCPPSEFGDSGRKCQRLWWFPIERRCT